MSDYKIKNISIGDLIVQEIRNTSISPSKTYRRNGIIINVGKTVSTIEWTNNSQPTENRYLTIFNITLRKMIMEGHVKHYPVQAPT